MDRRDFLAWSSLAGVAVIRQRAPVLRLVLLTSSGSRERASEMGVRMSVEEVERAALLFGGSVTLSSLPGDARTGAAAADLELTVKRERATAVLGGVDAAECAALDRLAEQLGILYFNVSSSDDALRGAECRRTTFHVIPSATMYRDALTHAEVSAEADARSVAWDKSLMRFGADTLNQRFATRYGQPMTDESWTGWLAVKTLWESALRAQTSDAGAIAAVLVKDSTRFDGHKGSALSFRPWDHQLRQPMYVLVRGAGAARTIEVPLASDPSAPSTTTLDELGVSSARTTCRWPK